MHPHRSSALDYASAASAAHSRVYAVCAEVPTADGREDSRRSARPPLGRPPSSRPPKELCRKVVDTSQNHILPILRCPGVGRVVLIT